MCRDEAGLGPVIEALSRCGWGTPAATCTSPTTGLNGNSQFPWPEATPLGPERMRQIRQQLGIGAWNGSGALYGTRAQVREAKRLLKAALRGKADRLQFVDAELLELVQRLARPVALVGKLDLYRIVKVLVPVYGLLKGVPTDATMASVYWRKKTPPPASPTPPRSVNPVVQPGAPNGAGR